MPRVEDSKNSAGSVPVLPYGAEQSDRMVRLSSFGDQTEAELHAGQLESAGIAVQIFNGNVNGLGFAYKALSQVELHVRARDLAQATEILQQRSADDLEPAEGIASIPLDSDGQPMAVVQLAAFESVREMRDAQTLLASAGIQSFLPPLARRGEKPVGVGKRFVVRVAADDESRATEVLQEPEPAHEEGDEPDLRCPKCHSWRTIPTSQMWKSFVAMICFSKAPLPRSQCVACRYEGLQTEFMTGAAAGGGGHRG